MNESHKTAVIMGSLTRILENARFSSSPQMSAFLRYVVDEAVAGNADRIKAYSVAVDALGKPESFDAQKDPCVRVLAMRLRESLADYYQDNDEPVVITIPRGSYKPVFTFATDAALSATSAANVEDPHSENRINAETVDSSANTVVALRKPESTSTSDNQEFTEGRVPDSIDTFESGLNSLRHSSALRWAIASVALMFSVWLVLSNRHQPASEGMDSASEDTSPESPQLAAAERASMSVVDKALRPRPTLPTVHIWANADSDELIRQIGTAVSGVLSKFKSLVVIRDHAGISQADAWPEDYSLTGSAMVVDGVIRVNAELTHVASGAIAYTASFEAAQRVGEAFTPRIIEMIEGFSAQLARQDGPLISDYRQRDGIRPELACLYNLQSQYAWDQSNERADNASGETTTDVSDSTETLNDRCGIIPSLLDETRLSSIMLSANLELDAARRATTPEKRQILLASAKTLSEQAVSLGPYRADTHAILMRTLRLTGDMQQALVHGARAMELNRFDSQFLRQYAELLTELDKSERAQTVRAMADKLDPLG